jgi:phage replication-related protein YjqB (UPF0714/DUF867 family)
MLIKRELDFIQGFEVADKLRESIIDSESPLHEKVNAQLESEFIFHLFRILVLGMNTSNFLIIILGGRLCQYEDKIDAYLETTKLFYKDLVSVVKTTAGETQIVSKVYKILQLELEPSTSKARGLFPSYSQHNHCYITIDRYKKQISMVYYLPN